MGKPWVDIKHKVLYNAELDELYQFALSRVRETTMTIARIRASDVRNRIGDILARVRYGGEHVVVERRGRPVAAIIGIEQYDHLIELQRQWEAEQRQQRFQAIRASAAENDLSEEQAFQLLDEA